MEEQDRALLERPEQMVIGRGGHILMAEDGEGAAIACVALLPYGDGVFELAKMAVAEALQGRGVGGQLMAAAAAKARQLAARALYLESNSRLAPAIRLYERTGFRYLPPEERPSSPYARVDVFMRMDLSAA